MIRLFLLLYIMATTTLLHILHIYWLYFQFQVNWISAHELQLHKVSHYLSEAMQANFQWTDFSGKLMFTTSQLRHHSTDLETKT